MAKQTVKAPTRAQAARSSGKVKQQGTSVSQYIKAGFGLGVGSFLATLIFIGLGMVFFIIGYVMWRRERAKPKEAQKRGKIITSIVLMGIGCLLGMGLGFSVLLGAIGMDMEL